MERASSRGVVPVFIKRVAPQASLLGAENRQFLGWSVVDSWNSSWVGLELWGRMMICQIHFHVTKYQKCFWVWRNTLSIASYCFTLSITLLIYFFKKFILFLSKKKNKEFYFKIFNIIIYTISLKDRLINRLVALPLIKLNFMRFRVFDRKYL